MHQGATRKSAGRVVEIVTAQATDAAAIWMGTGDHDNDENTLFIHARKNREQTVRLRGSSAIAWTAIVLATCTFAAVSVSSTHETTAPDASWTPTTWTYLPHVTRQRYRTIYTSQNLSGHSLFAECNPGGGTSCACSSEDVSLTPFAEYGQVTSNVRRTNTYVNAIGYKQFTEVFPDGEPIALGIYRYTGQVSLPVGVLNY